MSTANTPLSQPEWDRLQRHALQAAVVGIASFVLIGLVLWAVGNVRGPRQFFLSYLVAYNFWLSIALGCLVILMVQYLTGGQWGLALRRVLESGSRTLLLLAILFIPLCFGLYWLYLWAQPDVVAHDADLQHKRAYLNVPFFLGRAVLYFVVWLTFGFFLNRWSRQQDEPVPSANPRRYRLLSAPGLVAYGLMITFASLDWVMSLEPHWSSTIYPVLFAAGQLLTGFSFAVAVLILLSRWRPLSALVTPALLRDVGNLLLMFVMFWAYMAFSQLLLIWMENLPEEIPWYLRRGREGWQAVAVVLLVLHFCVPFVVLLFRDAKENWKALMVVALVLLVMRFVDIVFWIEPAYPHEGLPLYWLLDLTALLGLGGLWVWWFIHQLRRRPLLPANDPNLAEVLPND